MGGDFDVYVRVGERPSKDLFLQKFVDFSFALSISQVELDNLPFHS
jgi:hypothetical protein